MNILAIETSCDETAAAVVRDGREVRSNVVWSQIAVHQPFGGVVPELAARAHIEAIIPVTRTAMEQAGTDWDEIDAIAVTNRPGLSGALLVGVNFAKAAALARRKPLIGVHHIEGHLAALWIDEGDSGEIALPATVLVVSGGHTELIQIDSPGSYRVLGGTIDDAAGEAFDKGARLLELGYPGGPAIQKASERGDERAIPFPRAWLDDALDFSFSGLKTALLRLTKPYELPAEPIFGGAKEQAFVPHIARQFQADMPVADLAAGFQFAIVDVLVEKTIQAAQRHQSRSIGIVGGVAANRRLRDRLLERAGDVLPGIDVRIPAFRYCTDNAAMIGVAGCWAFARGAFSDLDLDVISREPLAERAG